MSSSLHPLLRYFQVLHQIINSFLGSFYHEFMYAAKMRGSWWVEEPLYFLVILFILNYFLSSDLFRSSSFDAPTKFAPWSQFISFGTSPLLTKRVKALRKASVLTPQATSKWTARTARQVKKHSYLFCRLCPRSWAAMYTIQQSLQQFAQMAEL